MVQNGIQPIHDPLTPEMVRGRVALVTVPFEYPPRAEKIRPFSYSVAEAYARLFPKSGDGEVLVTPNEAWKDRRVLKLEMNKELPGYPRNVKDGSGQFLLRVLDRMPPYKPGEGYERYDNDILALGACGNAPIRKYLSDHSGSVLGKLSTVSWEIVTPYGEESPLVRPSICDYDQTFSLSQIFTAPAHPSLMPLAQIIESIQRRLPEMAAAWEKKLAGLRMDKNKGE